MTSQRSARVAGGIIGSQGAGSSRKAGSQSPTGVGEPHELSERMSTGALLRPISRWVGRVPAIENHVTFVTLILRSAQSQIAPITNDR
jgi:hypothetical protein